MDEAVRDFLAGIDADRRAMFDRIDVLVRGDFPDAELTLAYRMPTYRLGRRRLHVGVWAHGLSLYGWDKDHAAEVLARHPQLRTSTGTVRVRPADLDTLSEQDLRQLIAAALRQQSEA
jgi:uncharacterized protein YdhG (YjbR/CyaY superfamily)